MQNVLSSWWRKAAVGVVVGLLGWCAAQAQARDWAREMFDHTSHDFGVVARGANVEHRFVIVNNNEEDIRIESVRSSCGCSTPQLTKQTLKSWEKAEIIVTLDTRREPGQKDATITVVFADPYNAEFQLHIHAYIRSDIVVQPGAVEFGSVHQGAAAQQTLAVSYAGRDDWRIERVECANPSIEATTVETNRASGYVNYNVVVKLKKDTPPGYIPGPLFLVTNDLDPRSSRIPVAIEGLVTATLTVRPSPLFMGVVEAGRPVTRNLAVQGRAPFRIVAVHSNDDRFQFQRPTEAKLVHVLPVTFLAKNAVPTTEKVIAKIVIETDVAGAKMVEVEASAQLIPANSAQPAAP